MITDNSQAQNCWNVIGIAGDRSCSQLSQFIHCRNCPVYSSAGRNLLERYIPEHYQDEWTQLFAKTSIKSSENLTNNDTFTVAIFRLQKEWLALSAQVLKESISPNKVHILPHRSNKILRGIVNIRGELQLCISLTNLLHLETSEKTADTLSPIIYSRMVVIEKGGNKWVFTVDEFYGLQTFDQQQLKDAPNGTNSVAHSYTKGFFHWQDRSLSYIDDELLFRALGRKILQ